jgi:DNA-binding transcriptional LysR family regulator
MPNHEVVDNVMTGRVDLGFVLSTGKNFETRVVDLCALDLICVAPQDHPIAKLKAVHPRDLTKYPFISFSTNLTVGTLVDDLFSREGIKRQFSVGVTQSSTACSLVRAGVGLSILDPFALMGENSRGLTKIKLAPPTQVKVKLLIPTNGRVSRSAQLFIKTAKEVVDFYIMNGTI